MGFNVIKKKNCTVSLTQKGSDFTFKECKRKPRSSAREDINRLGISLRLCINTFGRMLMHSEATIGKLLLNTVWRNNTVIKEQKKVKEREGGGETADGIKCGSVCERVKREKTQTKRAYMGATYLSHLVVDHHIVWFNITVHDSHTVTVVQSLKRTCTQKHITQVAACHLDQQKKNVSVTASSSSHFSPSVVRTCRNGYHNLSTSGTTPTGGQKNVGGFCVKSDTSSNGKRNTCTLKSVLLMHSKTSAGVLDCAATARRQREGGV